MDDDLRRLVEDTPEWDEAVRNLIPELRGRVAATWHEPTQPLSPAEDEELTKRRHACPPVVDAAIGWILIPAIPKRYWTPGLFAWRLLTDPAGTIDCVVHGVMDYLRGESHTLLTPLLELDEDDFKRRRLKLLRAWSTQEPT
jgi:hypothetical protein